MNIAAALNTIREYDYLYYLTVVNNLESYADNLIVKYAEILVKESKEV